MGSRRRGVDREDVGEDVQMSISKRAGGLDMRLVIIEETCTFAGRKYGWREGQLE